MGLLGAKHWLESSGYKPDMFIATDVSSIQVWYGALRIDQFKFIYTSPGAHTMESRGAPSPSKAVAKAIDAMYEIPLPPVAQGLDNFKLPVINVGMLGGGTVVNAIPREAWFTVDLRSLDSATQDRLESAVVAAARRIGVTEGVGFRMEKKMGIDYSKARPQAERLNHRAGTDGAGDQQSLPQAGHTRDCSDRCRVMRFEYRGEHGDSGSGDRGDDREHAASAGGECRGQQHRAGDQITDRAWGGFD